MRGIKELSNKQQSIFRRRISVMELKYMKHYRNIDIASSLGVDKATISRDLSFLDKNYREVLLELTAYIQYFKDLTAGTEYRNNLIYSELQKHLRWLASAQEVVIKLAENG